MSRYTFLTISSLGIFGLLAAYVYNHYIDLPLPKSLTPIIPSNIAPLSPMSGSTPAAIIVGSGLAGLSAASELISHNIHVHVLERAAKPGGNSMKASSGINGAPTRHQAVPNDDLFFSDTVKSAGKAMESFTQQREKLIGTLTNESAEAIAWLEDKGVDLSKVARLGGHSVGRTHRGRGNLPPGAAIMTTLLKQLGESQLFHLHTNCTVTKVLQDEESAGGKRRVVGVQYTRSSPDGSTTETLELHGPVIFASGGFAGDAQGLLAQHRPDLAGYPSTNEPRPGTQPLLTPLGVQLVDMDQVQVHPTGFVDPANPASPVKFLAAEVLRGAGGILLRKGERFVNELDTRERVTAAITQGEERESVEGVPRMWDIQLVLDSGVYESAKSHIDFYIFKGLIKKTTIGELQYAEKSLEAIKQYAAFAAGKSEDVFNRPTAAEWSLRDPKAESVVFVGDVTPVIHFTMGGALINGDAQVLGKSEGDGSPEVGEPIQGLWAAGEVAGGVHGANRLGGSSLLECVVFGRRAGRGVAKYISGIEAK